MDDPIELPDGRLVCKAHHLTICGNCCVDYSFMDEILDDDNDEEEEDDEEAKDDDEDDEDDDDGSAHSDDEELLTEEEMAAFRARMVARKGMLSSPLQVFSSGTD
jgi:hypothetical protein